MGLVWSKSRHVCGGKLWQNSSYLISHSQDAPEHYQVALPVQEQKQPIWKQEAESCRNPENLRSSWFMCRCAHTCNHRGMHLYTGRLICELGVDMCACVGTGICIHFT